MKKVWKMKYQNLNKVLFKKRIMNNKNFKMHQLVSLRFIYKKDNKDKSIQSY